MIKTLLGLFIPTSQSSIETFQKGILKNYKVSRRINGNFQVLYNFLFEKNGLYMNKVNLRLNEVMKVMAVVTCLLAPAAVIGSIFGMNFEVIPLTHQQAGFYIAVGLMFLIPIWMIRVFKKRGWF